MTIGATSILPEPPSHASVHRVMKKRGVTVDVGVNCTANFKPDCSVIASSERRMIHELQQLQCQITRVRRFVETSYSVDTVISFDYNLKYKQNIMQPHLSLNKTK
jgi:hypothetical protein